MRSAIKPHRNVDIMPPPPSTSDDACREGLPNETHRDSLQLHQEMEQFTVQTLGPQQLHQEMEQFTVQTLGPQRGDSR